MRVRCVCVPRRWSKFSGKLVFLLIRRFSSEIHPVLVLPSSTVTALPFRRGLIGWCGVHDGMSHPVRLIVRNTCIFSDHIMHSVHEISRLLKPEWA